MQGRNQSKHTVTVQQKDKMKWTDPVVSPNVTMTEFPREKVDPYRTNEIASKRLGKWCCDQDPRMGKEGMLGLCQ